MKKRAAKTAPEKPNIDLLPCPFCGSKAAFYENPWGVGVACKSKECGADVRDSTFNNTKSLAAKKWNRRK